MGWTYLNPNLPLIWETACRSLRPCEISGWDVQRFAVLAYIRYQFRIGAETNTHSAGGRN